MVHVDDGKFFDLAYTDSVSYTRFLDPSLAEKARRAARDAGVSVAFFGGYDGAEREIAAFFNSHITQEDLDWPISALSAKWDSRYNTLSHRDLLGAVMGIGIVGDLVGDIIVGEGQALIFVMKGQAAFISMNLGMAGKAKLTVSEADSMIAPRDDGDEARVVVASMRADAVISAVFRLSRGQAAELLRAEQVRRNHVVIAKADALVAQGDMLSARGYGRVRIDEAEATRKGRVSLICRVYR